MDPSHNVNRCLNVLKSSEKRKVIQIDHDLDITYTPDSMTHDESYALDCLQKLSINQRVAIYMKHVEGYASEEIAEALGVKKRTVDSLLYRGMSMNGNILRNMIHITI